MNAIYANQASQGEYRCHLESPRRVASHHATGIGLIETGERNQKGQNGRHGHRQTGIEEGGHQHRGRCYRQKVGQKEPVVVG